MDLSKHLENAAEAVKRRNYPFAVKVYAQLLAIQPDHGDARAGLRQALFKKAAQKAPSKLNAILVGGLHLVTASLLRLLGRHAAAARAYERYLVHDPLHEGANVALGTSLRAAGLPKSALAVFHAYAIQQPRCVAAARGAGALLYAEGKLPEALVMYEQVLKVDARDQEAMKARKDLAAEGALRHSGLEQAKSSRDLQKDKGATPIEKNQRLQLSAEEVSSELGDLESKLQEKPDDLKLLRAVARLREMDKDLAGALDCLERALTLMPNDADLLDGAGDLRLRLQEQMVQKALSRGDSAAAGRAQAALTEASVTEAKRRVARNPADLGLKFRLGEALFAAGDNDAAIAELQHAVKDPRKRVEAQFLLGRAFQKKALPDIALGQFEKALQAAGSSPMAKDALYEMGVICQDLGRREQALQHFARILEQDIAYRDVAQKVERLKAS